MDDTRSVLPTLPNVKISTSRTMFWYSLVVTNCLTSPDIFGGSPQTENKVHFTLR